MGFTEDEFYRTPMGDNDEQWVQDFLSGKFLEKSEEQMSEDERFRGVSSVYYEYLHNILAQKQQDYGPLNIALAPGGPLNGLLVRMNDKLQRLINLQYNSDGKSNYESMSDSYADLANYCVISMMVLDGVWKGVPEEYLP